MKVELRAALRAAGIDPDQPYEWQHEPSLATRPYDPDLDDYVPAENDDRHLVPLQAPEHRRVTSEVDRPAIDKTRRLAKAQQAHADVLNRLGITTGGSEQRTKGKRLWPKGQKIRSRGFQKKNGQERRVR